MPRYVTVRIADADLGEWESEAHGYEIIEADTPKAALAAFRQAWPVPAWQLLSIGPVSPLYDDGLVPLRYAMLGEAEAWIERQRERRKRRRKEREAE